MELSTLMKHISDHTLPHYMIWFGEEQKILDLYLNQVKNIGYTLQRFDRVEAALQNISKKSLDKSAKVYVITEDQEYAKMENKWYVVKQAFEKSKHILIIRYNLINKKLKFYSQNKADCIEFLHLQPQILTSYIQKELPNLSDKYCEKLCDMCGNDYGRILLEVDKIRQYKESINVDDEYEDECFCGLLEDGAIHGDIGDITFELTDAILGGYPDKSIKKLDEARRKGEPAMMIASILYNGFRNLLAYQGLGSNKKEAGNRTGMTGWQIKQCIEWSGGYSMKELIRNMLFCQSVEVGIKTGTLDEEIALDYLVLNCLR